jgi:hypothetical protein
MNVLGNAYYSDKEPRHNRRSANLSLPVSMSTSSPASFGLFDFYPFPDQEFEYQVYEATPGLGPLHDSSLVSHPANSSTYEASSTFNPVCINTPFHGLGAPCDSMPMSINNPNLGASNLALPDLYVGGSSWVQLFPHCLDY